MSSADSCSGFTAGILQISWLDEPPWSIPDRGLVYPAQITECHTHSEALPRDLVNAALIGLVVRAPDGRLSKITGVESFATMSLSSAIGRIGLLLVPVEES